MKKFKLFSLSWYLVLGLLNTQFCQSQEETLEIDNPKFTSSNKGKYFIYWGANRGSFSKSDITFKGSNYRFELKDVVARDKPKGYHIDYINPSRLTIPQTNFRVGYFITNHYKISIGFDHMKYVVVRDQDVRISGNINLGDEEAGSIFNGAYNNDIQNLSTEFLRFEHTDGLNYVNAEIGRMDDVSNLLGITNTDVFQVNMTEGIGGGFLFPRTNAKLLSKKRNDEFNIAGYGLSVKGGVNLTFLKHFFIQGEIKGGYINLSDIKTTESSSDSASQEFFFFESIIVLGGVFYL